MVFAARNANRGNTSPALKYCGLSVSEQPALGGSIGGIRIWRIEPGGLRAAYSSRLASASTIASLLGLQTHDRFGGSLASVPQLQDAEIVEAHAPARDSPPKKRLHSFRCPPLGWVNSSSGPGGATSARVTLPERVGGSFCISRFPDDAAGFIRTPDCPLRTIMQRYLPLIFRSRRRP